MIRPNCEGCKDAGDENCKKCLDGRMSKQEKAITHLLACANCYDVDLTKQEIAQILYMIRGIKSLKKLNNEYDNKNEC